MCNAISRDLGCCDFLGLGYQPEGGEFVRITNHADVTEKIALGF